MIAWRVRCFLRSRSPGEGALVLVCIDAIMQQREVQRNTGVEANARITAYAAVALLLPLLVVGLTGLIAPRLLHVHVLVGVLVLPPLLLKLGSTGYRFVRFYTNDPRYRAAGPPELGMRLLAPVLIFLTLVVFASGLELWLFGFRLGFAWLPIHHASGLAWLVVAVIHAGSYLRRTSQLALEDWRDHLAGATTRRGLAVGSLLLGAVIAVALLPYPSPFVVSGGG
jgi:hypothetical protein